ncbi:hypothetical protein GCM10017673_50290 [Streptosporangium violaceochromogenes]|nr:hypothetical protein GCM10017673_50290 [Streptosporangium violaceochromogenes]
MTGHPRTAGRHRAGQPPTAVHPRVWDGPARSEAERLGRAHPGWLVLYGLGSRRFYAIAAWPAPEPVMVDAATAGDLAERMRQAEAALLLQAPAPAPEPPPPSSRRGRRRTARPYPPEGSAA